MPPFFLTLKKTNQKNHLPVHRLSLCRQGGDEETKVWRGGSYVQVVVNQNPVPQVAEAFFFKTQSHNTARSNFTKTGGVPFDRIPWFPHHHTDPTVANLVGRQGQIPISLRAVSHLWEPLPKNLKPTTKKRCSTHTKKSFGFRTPAEFENLLRSGPFSERIRSGTSHFVLPSPPRDTLAVSGQGRKARRDLIALTTSTENHLPSPLSFHLHTQHLF